MKLVLVEWVDSHSGKGWQPIEEIKKNSKLLYCRSVGWVAHEDYTCISLTPHLSGEKNDSILVYVCGDITIPKKAVTKITVLRRYG